MQRFCCLSTCQVKLYFFHQVVKETKREKEKDSDRTDKDDKDAKIWLESVEAKHWESKKWKKGEITSSPFLLVLCALEKSLSVEWIPLESVTLVLFKPPSFC